MGDCMGCHIIFGLSPGKDTLIFEDSLQVVQDIILAKVSPIILRPGVGGVGDLAHSASKILRAPPLASKHQTPDVLG